MLTKNAGLTSEYLGGVIFIGLIVKHAVLIHLALLIKILLLEAAIIVIVDEMLTIIGLFVVAKQAPSTGLPAMGPAHRYLRFPPVNLTFALFDKVNY